jgi:predicted NBD/HSP70 family sugar kinase
MRAVSSPSVPASPVYAPHPSAPASAGQVLALVRAGRASTRTELGRVTGLSRTAVAARVGSLLAAGLLVEADEAPSSGGRPPGMLRFNRAAGVVLAVAVGRSRTQLAVCDLDGEELVAAEFDQETGVGPDELMPRVVEDLAALLAEAGRPASEVRAVGLSIPGTVDVTRGLSLQSPVMAGWDGVALAPYLHRLVDVPVHVDNDVNVMALSERRGLMADFDDLLLVKASTGLGAGIISHGTLLRGALGAAGEIGHTKTPAAAGARCRCGDTACLEAVAGGWALVREMRDRGRDLEHVRDLVDLVLDGDAEARAVVRESGRRVGEVLAGAVNLLNPQAVVVGGDMAAAYDAFVAGLRESLYANATSLATRELQVLPATHGSRAGLVGCAVLALDHVLDPAAVDAALS